MQIDSQLSGFRPKKVRGTPQAIRVAHAKPRWAPRPSHLGGYEGGELAGFSLKKTLRKVGAISRKIAFPIIPKQLKPLAAKLDKAHMKAIDKVAVPLAHAAAAYVTGGATLALSASMLMKEKQKKAQEALARGEQAEYDRQMAEVKAMQAQADGGAASVTANQETATPAAPRANITAVAPNGAAVQQQMMQARAMPGSFTIPSDRPEYREDNREQAMQVSQAKPGLPSWAIPAGIGAAVLLGVAMTGGRRR